jgi:hypothetical protein
VPPLNDLFNQAGMSLPEYLGKETKEPKRIVVEEKTAAEE